MYCAWTENYRGTDKRETFSGPEGNGCGGDVGSAEHAGYPQQILHKEAMQVLRENGNIKEAVRYYRKRQSGRQKLKRFLLQASAVIPDGIRAGLRKANSSRLLKK